MLIKAGTMLSIETGEYSDRCVVGPLRVVKDFDQAKIADEFRASRRKEGRRPLPEDFLPWLTRKGFVEDVEGALTWWVGAYGEFDPVNK